jgi:hypothetical protein
MKRASILVAAGLLSALLAPAPGRADSITPECRLDGVKAAGASCSAEFELTLPADEKRHVSAFYTHGDFHAVTIDPVTGASSRAGLGTRGSITLSWFDGANDGGIDPDTGIPRGNLVATYSCPTIALHDDYTPQGIVGGCSLVGEKKPFVAGFQALVATVTEFAEGQPAPNGIRMHGRLSLRSEGDLI